MTPSPSHTDTAPLVPVLDGHNDVLLRLHKAGLGPAAFLEGREGIAGVKPGHLDLPRARRGGLAGGFFAVFVPAPDDPPLPDLKAAKTPDGYAIPRAQQLERGYVLDQSLAMASLLYRLERASLGSVAVVRNLGRLEACLEEGTLAAILHLEGAEAVRPDLANLEALYQLGVRSLGLVWSRPNAFGHGVPFAFPSSPDTGPGLTDAGRDLVAGCGELGIVVDLAHLNQQGFWDVAAGSRKPLVVTHACVHELCNTARNLTGEQIDAVGRSGGIIGVNLHVGDLRADGRWSRDTPIDRWLDHVDYIAQRIGVEHVALGSDFDGALMPAELGDASGVQKLVDGLRRRGYNEVEIKKVATGNWLRVLGLTWS